MRTLWLYLSAIFVLYHHVESHATADYFRRQRDFYNFEPKLNKRLVNSLRRMNDRMSIFNVNYYGTHDTMTYLFGFPYVQTQTQTLQEQLDWGVRFLDIRVKHRYDSFELYHAFVPLGKNVDLVFDTVRDFLTKNPKEFVFIGLQHEGEPEGTVHLLCERLYKYMKDYGGLFFKPGREWNKILVGDVRGKIVLVGQEYFNYCNHTFNFNFCEKQMYWDLGNIYHIYYDKWERVKKATQKFIESPDYNRECFINFLGGSSSRPESLIIPEIVVSGHTITFETGTARLPTGHITPLWNDYPDFPRVNCFFSVCTIAFEGMNVLHETHFGSRASREGASYILISDFAGPNLMNSIFESNVQKMILFSDGLCTREEVLGDCCNSKLEQLRSFTGKSVSVCTSDCHAADVSFCTDKLIYSRLMTNSTHFCENLWERECEANHPMNCIDVRCNPIKLTKWRFYNLTENCNARLATFSGADIIKLDGNDDMSPSIIPSFPLIDVDKFPEFIINTYTEIENTLKSHAAQGLYTPYINEELEKLNKFKTNVTRKFTDCKSKLSSINSSVCQSKIAYINDGTNTCNAYTSCLNFMCESVENYDVIEGGNINVQYQLSPNATIVRKEDYDRIVTECRGKSKIYGRTNYTCLTPPTHEECLKNDNCFDINKCDNVGTSNIIPNECDCHYYWQCQPTTDPSNKWIVLLKPCPYDTINNTTRLYFDTQKNVCSKKRDNTVKRCD